MCLLKMCLCGFICVCLNDFVFLFFASSIWVKCWQQLPVSLLFYPLIQQEVAVCCSYIVFTGVASAHQQEKDGGCKPPRHSAATPFSTGLPFHY